MPRDALIRGLAVGIVSLVALAVIGRLTVARLAHAGEERGIFAESSMAADSVTVRRIRDRENGVICYVASGSRHPDYGNPNGVAISCVKEKQ